MFQSYKNRQIEWARHNVPTLALRKDEVLRVVVQRAIDKSRSLNRMLMVAGFILGLFVAKAVEDYAFAESLSRGESIALVLLAATLLGAVSGMIGQQFIRRHISASGAGPGPTRAAPAA